METEIETDPSPDDIFNILVASDIHLGFEEKDPERGEDSFNTFEEILQIGQENNVDFILLGGDLFHDAKPSPKCMYRCIDLLRKYCMGDKPIPFEFLSDQEKVFGHCSQPVVNYEDPNLNISIPVFSIHGNHDDPTGQSMISSLDILSSAGLVNYFGKWLNLTEVVITPMLMQKGETRLAIYGLSHIKDARLCRLFQDDKVKALLPLEHSEEWFNIFVLHQNRAERAIKNYIPESALPDYLDLVIWGHEHDCRIEPEFNTAKSFYVSQPGSPIATSLSEGESITKQVAIVTVFKKKFKTKLIKLKTVRPFVYRFKSVLDLDFEDGMENPKDQLEKWAKDEVENMIQEAKRKLTGHPKQPKLPLIRLKIGYTNETEMFSTIRFGQIFDEYVANSSEVILLKKESKETYTKRKLLDEDVMKNVLDAEDDFQFDVRVEDYVKKYYDTVNTNEDLSLKVLSVTGLNEAVVHFVDKQNKDAIDEISSYQTSRVCTHLRDRDITEDNIDDEIYNYRVERQNLDEREVAELRTHLEVTLSNRPKKKSNNDEDLDPFMDADEDDESVFESPAASGRGAARGKGPRGGAARGGAGARGGTRARARGGARGGARGKGRGAAAAAAGQQTLMDSFASQPQDPSQDPSPARRSGRASASNNRYKVGSYD